MPAMKSATGTQKSADCGCVRMDIGTQLPSGWCEAKPALAPHAPTDFGEKAPDSSIIGAARMVTLRITAAELAHAEGGEQYLKLTVEQGKKQAGASGKAEQGPRYINLYFRPDLAPGVAELSISFTQKLMDLSARKTGAFTINTTVSKHILADGTVRYSHAMAEGGPFIVHTTADAYSEFTQFREQVARDIATVLRASNSDLTRQPLLRDSQTQQSS